MSSLTRVSAADEAAYRSMLAERGEPGQAVDEPTPLEALGEPPRPRYEWRIAGRGDRPTDGYWCWDAAEDRPVSWHRCSFEARDAAEDRNAEDFPDAGDWWAYLPPGAELDARWTLSIAGGGPGLPMTDLDLPRGSTRLDADEEARMWGRGRPGDDRLIDRLQARDGYVD